MKKITFISILLILTAIISNIFLDYYIIPKRLTRIDQSQHFYDMKKWYESGKLPVTSARFIASQVVNDELTTPRVPGGAYYIFYTLFYKLASESLMGAKIINCIFSLLLISIFLIWVYKKFGVFITSILTPLIICNGYFVMASTDFWNPNITLLFSFIFLIFLFEYIENSNEVITKVSAVLIFPILAIMAQGHFVTFFSMIPTIIVYLALKYKKTIKYILYWSIGVFISFLEYLPYIVSELKNGFYNTNLIFAIRSGFGKLPFPQMHAITLFPTNEISVFYGNSLYGSISYWMQYPVVWLGVLFLFLSVLFSFFCIIRSIYLIVSKKNIIDDNRVEYTLIELVKIFLLFIPVTIVVNILAKSKPGTFHYLYSAFSISYIPIILFLYQNKDKILSSKKYFYSLSSLVFINIFVMFIQLYIYVSKYEYPRSVVGMEKVADILLENAGNSEISITGVYADDNYMYRDIAVAYFPHKVWNQNNSVTNNMYLIVDKIGTYSKSRESVSNYFNNYFSNNTKFLGGNDVLLVYKFTGSNRFMLPPKK